MVTDSLVYLGMHILADIQFCHLLAGGEPKSQNDPLKCYYYL